MDPEACRTATLGVSLLPCPGKAGIVSQVYWLFSPQKRTYLVEDVGVRTVGRRMSKVGVL